MSLTPVEVRHFEGLRRGAFGYKRRSVHALMDDVADSFEAVWRERAELIERVESLETEVARHLELEGLLRATLVSAERASQDTKEQARREAEVIVAEANSEARRVLRDAIGEKERVLGELRRIRALLRSALEVVDDVPGTGEEAEATAVTTDAPTERREAPQVATSTVDDGETTDPGLHRLVS